MKKEFFIIPIFLILLFSPVITFGEMKWTCATEKAEFGKRYWHQSVVFDNKMWVLNGINGNGTAADIWCSTNGQNWTKAVDFVPYSARMGFPVTVFNDCLWIIGGEQGC